MNERYIKAQTVDSSKQEVNGVGDFINCFLLRTPGYDWIFSEI